MEEKPVLVYTLPAPDHPSYNLVKSALFCQQATDQFSMYYQPENFDQNKTRGTVMVVGLPEENSLLKRLLNISDISLMEKGIKAGDRLYFLEDFNLDLVIPLDSAVFIVSTSNSWDNLLQYNQPYSSQDSFCYRISARKGAAILEEGHLQPQKNRYMAVPDLALNPELATELKKDREILRKNLTAAAQPLLYGDFTSLLPLVQKREILFLGESPHHDPHINAFVTEFSDYLNRNEGYKVFGKEGLFSHILYTEESSPPGFLHTEIDIDHAINHTKSSTVNFFTRLSQGHRDPVQRKKLEVAAKSLYGTVSRESLINWVDNMERIYLESPSGFSLEDQELFTYSLGLERASANFQFYGNKERPADMSLLEANEFRGRYFRENILRAWKKARNLGGGLICHVGGAHNILTPFGPGDYLVGRISEARFFAEEQPETKGKTASLLIAKLDTGFFPTTFLRNQLMELMGDSSQLFLNFTSHVKELSAVFPEYFHEGKPKYHGLVLIR